jgi:hypothetical protein
MKARLTYAHESLRAYFAGLDTALDVPDVYDRRTRINATTDSLVSFELVSQPIENKLDNIDFHRRAQYVLAYHELMGAIEGQMLPLSEGTNSTVYQGVIGEKRVVVKIPKNQHAAREQTVLSSIASARLEEEPMFEQMLAYDPNTGTSIWEYIDGEVGTSVSDGILETYTTEEFEKVVRSLCIAQDKSVLIDSKMGNYLLGDKQFSFIDVRAMRSTCEVQTIEQKVGGVASLFLFGNLGDIQRSTVTASRLALRTRLIQMLFEALESHGTTSTDEARAEVGKYLTISEHISSILQK